MSEEQRTASRQHQQYVSDVFHTLGQPLTALQFALEMALRKPEMKAAEYRLAIEQALRATERIITSSRYLRQLAEADDPGTSLMPLNAATLLRQAIEDFDPVAESLGVETGVLIEGSLTILAEKRRLLQLFSMMIDHGLHRALPSTRLHVTASLQEGVVLIEVTTRSQALLWGEHAPAPTHADEETDKNMKIAAHMAEAIGGTLRVYEHENACCLTLRLPVLQ